MKKFLSTLFFCLVCLVIFAQAPQKFSYQAVVRDAGNNLVATHAVGVRVSLLQGSPNGAAVFVETHTITTNTNGLMTLEIGAGTAVSGDFSTIDWADGPYFLKTETDPDGGTNYTIEGTQQLLSVPYALYAATSGNGAGPQGPQGEQGPAGQNGADGLNGQDGLSAYQIWLNAGNNGTEAEFLASLVGAQGPQGEQGIQGEQGVAGPQGERGLQGEQGPQGEVGPQGPAGQNGADGLNGQDGLSAYQIWLNAGNNGTEAEFLTSLVGEQGPQGEQGVAGPQGERGLQGEQGPQGLQGEQGPAGVGIPQTLSITGNQLSISDGNSVDLPEGFDGDYNSLTNRPSIPTVPTNVSAFTNDAGYLTQATVQEAANIPTQVSAFNNDAGYITSADVPTNVSELNNDANYITAAQVPAQVNADWNATEGAAQIMNKPALFSGDYNDLSNQPTIPTVPTNVSAFTNDAGYVTQSTLTTENYITQNDLITNNYVTAADIPTQVSAFNNDAGYITSADVPTNVSELNNDADYITAADIPAYQVLSISNDTIFLSNGGYAILPAGFDGDYNSLSNRPNLFSGDYNDLNNRPEIPTVPTNVSAFTNDAGYLTQATVQEAANIPTQISAFENDANYITAAEVPAQVNADWNATSGAAQIMNKPELFSGDYNDLTNQPTIPTVPTNVSAFENDRGYITGASIPTNVSAFVNDRGYVTSAAIPTNVSAFVNDRGYITSAEVPAQVNADWNATSGAAQIMNKPELFSGDYNDLSNQPTIPTVPTNVSAFTNDAGYISSYTEQQILSISNDTIYLTGGSFVKLPAGFSGSYNDLTEKPTLFSGSYNDLTDVPETPEIPTQVSTFNNDAGYLTRDSLENYNLTPADIQALLDRIEALEHSSNAIPSVITESIIPNGEGIIITGGNVLFSGTSAVMARGVCWGTNENPTIEGNHTSDGVGLGRFTSNINGLVGNTTYYIRAYATNETGTTYGGQLEYSFIPCGTATVSDVDGNTYNTVLIGTQCWMKQNLKTTKYADGTAISNGPTTSTDVAYWYYPNNNASNKATYGLLYNWKAVMRDATTSSSNPSGVQGICPDGWHVPSEAEWTQLTDYVSSQSQFRCSGNSSNIAKALASTSGWNGYTGSDSGKECYPGYQQGSNNSTGFSALPAGDYRSSYYNFGNVAYLWSATEHGSDIVHGRTLAYDDAGVSRNYTTYKSNGSSVRCVRD